MSFSIKRSELMQAKHIVSKSSPVWQHINDRSGVLSVKNSIGICYNRIKIKRVKWKQMKTGVEASAVIYLKCAIDSLSLKTLLGFIKLIKNLLPHHEGNFLVEIQMYKHVVVWETWAQTGAVNKKISEKCVWSAPTFCGHMASSYIHSTGHVLAAPILRCPRGAAQCLVQALKKMAILPPPTTFYLLYIPSSKTLFYKLLLFSGNLTWQM